MTKTSTVLEDVFDLPANPANETLQGSTAHNIAELMTPALLDKLDKIDAALPVVKGLESTETELDELADLAIDAFKNLNEMAFNCDTRHAGEISGAAATYLGHAITARKNKIEKKLKMVELQLKKLKLDQEANKLQNSPEMAISGEAVLLDRNQLLEKLLGSNIQ